MLGIEQLRNLPYSLDYTRFGPLLDRMAQSRLVLHQVTTQMPSNLPDEAVVCVFGSVARGEMDLRYSDIDLMFINIQEAERNTLLNELAAQNQCLHFHDALDLLRKGDEEAKAQLDLRFPCLDRSLLLSDHGEEPRRRRIQFLLEAIPIAGARASEELSRELVRWYQLEPKQGLRETPQQLISDLHDFFENMGKYTAARDDKRSDFFAKFLVVRELGELASRLGLLQAIFRKRPIIASTDPALEVARLLRQPPLLKILYWGSPEFFAGKTMSRLLNRHPRELSRAVSDQFQGRGFQAMAEMAMESPTRAITELVLHTAQCYNDSLDQIYEPETRAHLQNASPNVVNWRTDPKLEEIVANVDKTYDHFCALACVLESIFVVADKQNVFGRPYSGGGLEAAVKYVSQQRT